MHKTLLPPVSECHSVFSSWLFSFYPVSAAAEEKKEEKKEESEESDDDMGFGLFD